MAVVNLTSPYDIDAAKIARAQKYAEMLQQQAMAPDQTFSYNGIQAPIPKTAGLAKILQGLAGGYFEGKAEEDAKKLGEDTRAEAGNLIGKMVDPNLPAIAAQNVRVPATDEERADMLKGIVGGSEASPLAANATFEAPGGTGFGGTAALPARAKTPAERYADIIGGKSNPLTSGFADLMLAQMMKPKEYGTTIQNVTKDPRSKTGYSGMVLDKNTGEPKFIDVPEPMTPYTTGTVDAAATREQAERHWGSLSANQQQQLLMDYQKLGLTRDQAINEAYRTFNETARAVVPGQITLPNVTNAASPLPNAGQPSNQPAPLNAAPLNAASPNAAPPSVTPPVQRPGPTPVSPLPTNIPNFGGILNDPAVPPKEKTKLIADMPKELSAVQTIIRGTDTLSAQVQKLLDNKDGLGDATGRFAGSSISPTIRQASKSFENDFSVLKNTLALQALAEMRAASKTGGAVGNVTEKEYEILASKFGTLNTTDSPEKVEAELKSILEQLNQFRSLSKTTFDQTYGSYDKNNAYQWLQKNPNNENAEAVQWLSENPNDKKAAAVRKKIGFY